MRAHHLRTLSPATLELFKKLTSWPMLRRHWIGDSGTLSILDQIGQRNEPAAIRDLMSFGLVRDDKVRVKARSVIQNLFVQVPFEALPALDDWLRLSWGQLEDWYGMRPEGVDTIVPTTDTDRVFLGLVASHRSGYVRAAALRALDADPSDLAIPFCLIRLGDWVSEVQRAAESAVQGKLRPEYAKTFVACLGLVDRLANNSRFQPEYSQWIDDLLARPACTQAIREGMESPSREVRRHCYRAAVKNTGLRVDQVLNQALNDNDVLVRRWAFTTGTDVLPERRDELTARAAKDSYGPIRRIGFDAIAANPATTLQELLPFLIDSSGAIRRECQSLASSIPGGSPAQFYRQQIRNPNSKRLDIGVTGLAETGDRTDVDEILQLLASRSGRVRRAVIRALRILGADGNEQTLLHLISTDVPSVAREAAFTLFSLRTVSTSAIWTTALTSGNRQIRLCVLMLLKKARKWEQLRFYLEAVVDSDPNIGEFARRLFSQWMIKFNRSFVQPTASDLESCGKALALARHRLPAHLGEQLEFILRTSAN